jgi:hypothetical protein
MNGSNKPRRHTSFEVDSLLLCVHTCLLVLSRLDVIKSAREVFKSFNIIVITQQAAAAVASATQNFVMRLFIKHCGIV